MEGNFLIHLLWTAFWMLWTDQQHITVSVFLYRPIFSMLCFAVGYKRMATVCTDQFAGKQGWRWCCISRKGQMRQAKRRNAERRQESRHRSYDYDRGR